MSYELVRRINQERAWLRRTMGDRFDQVTQPMVYIADSLSVPIWVVA